MMSKESRGSLYAILSGFLYGFIGYFGVSVIHDHFSIANMLFWRFLISSLAILPVVIKLWPTLVDTPAEYIRTFTNGALFYSCSTMLYFYACPYIGTGLAMVIFFTYPVIVMMFNRLIYGHKMSGMYYVAIAIIFIGW